MWPPDLDVASLMKPKRRKTRLSDSDEEEEGDEEAEPVLAHHEADGAASGGLTSLITELTSETLFISEQDDEAFDAEYGDELKFLVENSLSVQEVQRGYMPYIC
jgi:hypothetical protein